MTLPSVNAFPTASSPNNISYCWSSTSCIKKTFCVDAIVVTSKSLAFFHVTIVESLTEFSIFTVIVLISTFWFGIINLWFVFARLTINLLLIKVPSFISKLLIEYTPPIGAIVVAVGVTKV